MMALQVVGNYSSISFNSLVDNYPIWIEVTSFESSLTGKEMKMNWIRWGKDSNWSIYIQVLIPLLSSGLFFYTPLDFISNSYLSFYVIIYLHVCNNSHRIHRSILIVDAKDKIVGGMVYRPFESRSFSEIVFCVIDNHQKQRVRLRIGFMEKYRQSFLTIHFSLLFSFLLFF